VHDEEVLTCAQAAVPTIHLTYYYYESLFKESKNPSSQPRLSAQPARRL